jgi:hypothetical protein
MKISNWKVVAELIGIAAIVASLIFVGLEMRQQQVLARAELSSASFDYMRSVRQSFSNGQFAESYIKMLRSPESLSDEEIAMINGFFHELIQLVERDCFMVYLGVFQECTYTMNRFFPEYLGNKYAQSWWEETKDDYDPGLRSQVSLFLEDLDPNTSLHYVEDARKAFQ